MSVALVTGGASGFGAEVARQLVRRGDSVVLCDVDEQGGQAVAGELGATFLHCDVSDLDQVRATTEAAEQVHGGLDLVFLNAGISTGCGIGEDFDLAKYRRAMGINLDGVAYAMTVEIEEMLKVGGGAIVNIASVEAHTILKQFPAYVASKHGLIGLTKGTASDYAARSIRINSVSPGVIRTPLTMARGAARKVMAKYDNCCRLL